MRLARLAVAILAGMVVIGGLALAAGDGDLFGGTPGAVAFAGQGDDDAIRRDDVLEPIDPDDDDDGDGDDTSGDDGTNGGNNTGDGDSTNGNDGTGGGDNTGDGGFVTGTGTGGGTGTGTGDSASDG